MSTQQPEEVDLAQELRELGQQLKKAIGIATQYRKAKEFEQKISQAVQELTAQIDRVVKAAAERATVEPIKKAGERVKETAQAFKESGVKDDFERGLAKSVRVLNQQIRRAIEEAEKGERETKV